MSEAWFHATSMVLIIVAAAIPVYLTFKLKGKIRILAAMFSVFMGVHGVYHILGTAGYVSLGENVFEPASVVALVLFGLFFLKITRRQTANAA